MNNCKPTAKFIRTKTFILSFTEIYKESISKKFKGCVRINFKNKFQDY